MFSGLSLKADARRREQTPGRKPAGWVRILARADSTSVPRAPARLDEPSGASKTELMRPDQQQLRAKGVPGGVIGAIARKKQAAPGQKNGGK